MSSHAGPGPGEHLMVIGAMKAGTSTLFDVLAQHPQICAAVEKEPEYFTRHQRHGRPVARYADLWPDYSADRHRYALEASTGYTKHPAEPGVPERIADAGLRPRFVYVVRDPVDRIVSHLSYRGLPVPAVESLAGSMVVAISDYSRQLDRYIEVFGPGRVQVLSFDVLRTDPSAAAATVYRWLGIHEGMGQSAAAASPRNVTGLTSPWARRLRRGRAGRALAALPEPMREAGKRALLTVRPAPARQQLAAGVEIELRRLLGESMARLHTEHGVDVSQWGFPAEV